MCIHRLRRRRRDANGERLGRGREQEVKSIALEAIYPEIVRGGVGGRGSSFSVKNRSSERKLSSVPLARDQTERRRVAVSREGKKQMSEYAPAWECLRRAGILYPRERVREGEEKRGESERKRERERARDIRRTRAESVGRCLCPRNNRAFQTSLASRSCRLILTAAPDAYKGVTSCNDNRGMF